MYIKQCDRWHAINIINIILLLRLGCVSVIRVLVYGEKQDDNTLCPVLPSTDVSTNNTDVRGSRKKRATSEWRVKRATATNENSTKFVQATLYTILNAPQANDYFVQVKFEHMRNGQLTPLQNNSLLSATIPVQSPSQ